ncbi:MAG: hypothetical protein GFH25_541212n160, partial [Chloroflexi bacterium AL-N10]|nr:hypothetical protein [Chloroflexi bacterium AL-N10]
MISISQNRKPLYITLCQIGGVSIILLLLAGCGARESSAGMAQTVDQTSASPEVIVTPTLSNNMVTPAPAPTLASMLTPTPTLDIYQAYGRWDEITHFREELQRTDLSEED